LKVIGEPIQPFMECGVTVIIPVISNGVQLFGADQGGIFPNPEYPIPIDEIVLFHVYVVPERLLLNGGIFIVRPGQTVIELIESINGVRLTVTVKLVAVPAQKFEDVGITVIVEKIAAPLLF